MQINRGYGPKRPSWLMGVIVTVVVVALSFGVAFIWQQRQDKGQTDALANTSDQPADPAPQEEQSGGEESEIPQASSIAPLAPQEQEEQLPQHQYAREAIDGALPPAPAVDNSYFDDAIFFGDSLSDGIFLYQIMPNAKVVAYTGINTVNALTKEVVPVGDKTMTLLDAAAQYGDMKKVYILLGGNGLGYEQEAFVKGYRQFIEAVKAQYPAAVIYLQSMPPVTTKVGETYPNVSQQKIDSYNLLIAQLAQQEQVHFVDIAQALVDDAGNLPLEASPVDGMHFTPEYYKMWFDYLKQHTITEG